jgi:hypothetical protein
MNAMQIINATEQYVDYNYRGVPQVKYRPVSDSQRRRDMLPLRKRHDRLCNEHPTWGMFGGTIKIGTRQYQVC